MSISSMSIMTKLKGVFAMCYDKVKITGYWTINPSTYPIMQYVGLSDTSKTPDFNIWGVPPFSVIVHKTQKSQ